MTQIKCRTLVPKGLGQQAWKWLNHREATMEGIRRRSQRIEDQKEAEKANVTLPKLKWMENK